jgi:hypothetical protein
VLGDEHSDLLDSVDSFAFLRKSTAEKRKLSGRCDCRKVPCSLAGAVDYCGTGTFHPARSDVEKRVL